MARVESDCERLPASMRINQIASDKIFGIDGLRVTDGKRRFQYRPLHRPPNVDYRKAMLQELAGLLWKEVPDTLRTRRQRIIIVRAFGGQFDHLVALRACRIANNVIEHDCPGGTRRFF